MESGSPVAAVNKITDCAPQFVRITSGGKIRLWVEFSLNFLRDNPGKPIILHTLPINPSANELPEAIASASTAQGNSELVEERPEEDIVNTATSGSAKAKCNSTQTIPRLISVVEIIKREYIKSKEPGLQNTSLYQYNYLGHLEEPREIFNSKISDEGIRQKEIAAVLEGHNFLRQEKNPYMKITLCTIALPALESQSTYQSPPIRKLTRSARARQRRKWALETKKLEPSPIDVSHGS